MQSHYWLAILTSTFGTQQNANFSKMWTKQELTLTNFTVSLYYAGADVICSVHCKKWKLLQLVTTSVVTCKRF